jgi:hypothetical protein
VWDPDARTSRPLTDAERARLEAAGSRRERAS